MDLSLVYIAIAVVVGVASGWILNSVLGSKSLAAIQKQRDDILEEAQSEIEDLKQETKLKLKEEHLETKQQLENEFQRKSSELKKSERAVKEREASVEKRLSEIRKKDEDIKHRELVLENEKSRINETKEYYHELIDSANERLESIAGMTKEEALENLKQNLITEANKQTDKIINDIYLEAQKSASRKAKDAVLQAIGQTAAEQSVETTISVVNLPDDSMKGRIIGREGRNIRSFEMTTGVDILIDDTPKTIILSCFDPIRREIAKISLERLIEDGRIHPGRIEDVVEKVTEEMDDRHLETGENALFDLGIHGVHSDISSLLGKLRFRTVSGQNVLQHSIEVANIASVMANELGLDPHLAKRAAILSEIGRVVDKVDTSIKDRTQEILKKYNEKPVVLSIIDGSDSVEPPTHPLSVVLEAAKHISTSRPGARREVYETFTKRLDKLEKISKSFEGVEDAYAIQAGREVRVMIDYDELNDDNTQLLASRIANKIEEELEYPGQIKVTLFREFRSVDYAK